VQGCALHADYFQHNINDAIAVLPRLQTGLDVNVRFTGVTDFEYTEECIIFDLLNIQLYHGWLVDPQTEEVSAAVQSLSYNQLVERIIEERGSADSLAVSRALVAEQVGGAGREVTLSPSGSRTPAPS
jgi:hypothetical protein